MIPRYSLPEMVELWSEQRKFQAWLDVEIAACEAWAERGAIPAEALAEIRSKAAFSVERIDEIEATVHHDVIAFTTNLAESIGPSSRFVHMGLTSSDVTDTAQSVRMVRAMELILEKADGLLGVLEKQARAHRETIMVGRTHGIHAEPIVLGLKFLLWLEEMRRNRRRLEQARETIRAGKISGAVGTYAHTGPEIERAVCRRLGLEPAPVSTQVLQRDRHAEYMAAIAIAGATIEKIATEIRGLQRTDVREVEEPFRKGQKGSSAMPHKRNPVGCENLAGLARLLRSNLIAALENVALWHERDISHSSVERVILPDSTTLLHYMLNRLTGILDGLHVYPDAMRANLDKTRGLLFSQKVLLELIEQGMTREDAYLIVQNAAMKTWEGAGTFRENLLAEPAVQGKVTPELLDRAMDYRAFLSHVDAIYRQCGVEV
ncbi:adenylosuccinate lyase [Candidatus Sumerlaeota bacterium]|nr:adenylosuccinate lyase [Candidatus Sumerlaeota bacterium]